MIDITIDLLELGLIDTEDLALIDDLMDVMHPHDLRVLTSEIEYIVEEVAYAGLMYEAAEEMVHMLLEDAYEDLF